MACLRQDLRPCLIEYETLTISLPPPGAVAAPLGAAALWAAACLHRSLDASAAAAVAPGCRLGAMEAAASAPDAALTAAYLRLIEALTWVSLLETPVKRGERSCGKHSRDVACM